MDGWHVLRHYCPLGVDCVHMTRIAQIARIMRNGLSHPADFIGRNRCGQSRIGWEDGDNGHMITSSITAPCICRGIMKYIPKLADAKIVRTWAGYEDLCADGVPVLGPVKEVPGLLLACAFTGHGFGISPIVGKLLSELAMGKETTLDLHELRYDRFQAVI